MCKVCMFRCMSFDWKVQRDVNLCYKSRFQWNNIYSCPWSGSWEDKENWLYFLKHFRNSGLANSISFFMSDRDKGLINAMRKVFPDMDCNLPII